MITTLTAPACRAVSLEEARQQLRLDGDDEDLLLAAKLDAAQAELELMTGLRLCPQTLSLELDVWEDEIAVPVRPCAVTQCTENDGRGSERAGELSGWGFGPARSRATRFESAACVCARRGARGASDRLALPAPRSLYVTVCRAEPYGRRDFTPLHCPERAHAGSEHAWVLTWAFVSSLRPFVRFGWFGVGETNTSLEYREGAERRGRAGHGKAGTAGLVTARHGAARQARLGTARLGTTRLGD